MGKKKYIICFIFAIVMFISLFKINEYKKITANNTSNTVSAKFVVNPLEVKNIKVIAHRGQCSGEPENSLKAIKSSIICKVDYAEIDVQETRDGVVVLMHDRNLKRLTGSNKNVDELNFNEIEKLSIESLGQTHYIERIPTLDSVIKECNNKLNLIIEIKPYGNTVDLTNKVVKIIDDNNFANQCKVHSVSYSILLNVKKLNPNIQTGYIISRPMNNLASLNVNFYSVQEDAVSKEMVNNIHHGHKQIYAWTVDNKLDMYKLIKSNVDGIISDKPKLLLNIKKNNNIQKL